jgi:hypothetical protein
MAIEHAPNGERLETPQVSTRVVVLNAIGFLVLLAFAIGVLDVVYYRQVPVQSFQAPEKFPEPRVETGQRAQLHRLEAAQQSRLNAYRWVDRKQGLVEIPIGRAMHILAAEGDKAYQPLAPATALATPSAGAERLITPQIQQLQQGAAPKATPQATSPATPAKGQIP